jgi:hypothetical protein
MIEVKLAGLRSCQIDQQPVMILRDEEGGRYLPIVIGPYEAQAISLGWQKVQVYRPMSHDLIVNIINQLGAEISYIHIHDFTGGIFYAYIALELGGQLVKVDSRPSDAVALAVRKGVPIFAEGWILEEAALASEAVDHERPPSAEPTPEESEKLAVFRDFINSLDLDDLGRK